MWRRPVPAYLEHAESASRGGPVDAVARSEGCREPSLERIGPEIALDDEPGIRSLVEAGDPSLEKSVQLVLSDADRRIRADGAEGHVVGNIVGQHGVDIRETQRLGVSSHEIQCPLVDIDSPDGGVRRLDRERQRDRTPAAAEVEQISAGWRGWRVRQQDGSARIDVIRAEDAAGGRDVDLGAGQSHSNAAKILSAGRRRAEVVVPRHACERSGGPPAWGRKPGRGADPHRGKLEFTGNPGRKT